MKKRLKTRPTSSELQILNMLWILGTATVRSVHEALPQESRRGYTTTLKLMQIMVEKGFVVRDESSRSHVYRAVLTRENVQGRLVGDLMNRAFDGSAAKLVMKALSEKPASAEEVAQIRRVLDELEGKRGKDQ